MDAPCSFNLVWCGKCSAVHSASAGCPTGFPLPTQPAVVATGWECPRCRSILAPHVGRCWCPATVSVTDGTTVAEVVWPKPCTRKHDSPAAEKECAEQNAMFEPDYGF